MPPTCKHCHRPLLGPEALAAKLDEAVARYEAAVTRAGTDDRGSIAFTSSPVLTVAMSNVARMLRGLCSLCEVTNREAA